MSLVIREVPHASAWYEDTKRLRDEVLRRPNGMVLSEKDTDGEEQQIHIAAMLDNNVIGTVLLKPVSPERIKLRQMAVSPTFQNNGTGRSLVQFAEASARSRQFRSIECNARVYAQGFYEKLGYRTEGKAFVEVNLPAIKMIKML